MKKYATLCFFAFAFIVGTQFNFAQQETFNANELAIKKTESLKMIMDLDNEQQNQLIYLFQSNEELKNQISKQTRDGVISLKRLKAIENKEEAKLKQVLSEKQYNIYLENKKKKNDQ